MSLRIGNQHRSKCRGKFGRNDTQFKTAVAKLLNKFGEIGTIKDARQRVYHRRGRSPGNIVAVRKSVAQDQRTSINNTLHNIFTKYVS